MAGTTDDRVKRVFDLSVSSMTVLILSPLMLVLGLLVRLCSGGPVFFGSPKVRVGHCANRTRGGRSRMLVQQSMIIPMSADAEWKP